ncbi:phosphatase PAP2 family protein [Roseovarius sp. SCSIO 43702]|uniref:phosphatase PAP2 family protein n=1 Tax=Roseovarius sp. SCSIO 43702 TaxID=2823043 RepID=UPI001C731AAA|nr:phosphatase PAP2 family protein [Roseovarius sp. SCSIO 43702]QYX55668.1 phosphatase PAP2 family protein [Roseovarius sp. SCSIO 43702]
MILTITSRRLYLWALALVAVNGTFILVTGAQVDTSALPRRLGLAALYGVLFAGFCHLSRNPRHAGRYMVAMPRHVLEFVFFMTLFAFNLQFLNYLSMDLLAALPLQDDFLHGMDLWLGIDWMAYFEWVHARPRLISVMEWCYNQLAPVSFAAMIYLIVANRVRRARLLLETMMITAVFCISVGAFFPAEAAVQVLVAEPERYTNFATVPGIYHLADLAMLRDPTTPTVVAFEGMQGLVTFPSYHTASGILLCVFLWRTWAFLPSLAYSTLMIAASPIFGGHYIVDQIAGALVALAFAALFLRIEGRVPRGERNALPATA